MGDVLKFPKSRVKKQKKQNKLEEGAICCYCNLRLATELHEPLQGINRQKSIALGLQLPLCRQCHALAHSNIGIKRKMKQTMQKIYELNYGTREDFMRDFNRNYLD